jgi:cation transport ATPase
MAGRKEDPMADRAAGMHFVRNHEQAEHQHVERRASSRAAVTEAGIAAGLLAGLVMAAFVMTVAATRGTGALMPLQLIAATFYGPDALVGGVAAAIWGGILHLAVAAALGLIFAWIVGPYPRGADAIGWGVVYGIAAMFVTTSAVLPWADPTLYLRVPQMTAVWVMAHLVFGFCLAITPRYIRRS